MSPAKSGFLIYYQEIINHSERSVVSLIELSRRIIYEIHIR